MTMLNVDMLIRNAEIGRRYMEGETLQSIGNSYGISRMRVKQIVKKAGLWRKRTREDVEFLGVNLAPGTKDALRAKADERGVSMSKLTNDAITLMLKEEEC